MLTGAARPILDRWFESGRNSRPPLRPTRSSARSWRPSMPGTAYVLFHHVMGETNGKRGVWSYVKGGMGGLTQAIANAARRSRRRDSHRSRSRKDSDEGRRRDRRRDDQRRRVRSQESRVGVDCRHHVPEADGYERAAAGVRRRDRAHFVQQRVVQDQRGARAAAELHGDAGSRTRPATSRHVHLCPDQDFIERGYDDAKYGKMSQNPIVECTMPSSLDPTVAPPGKHLMSMFTQYAPYELKDGPWTDALRNEYADRCFDIVEQYAPGFKDSVIDRQILTPVDLETHLRPDRRQHLPRRDAARSTLHVPSGVRIRELQYADQEPVHVRSGDPSGRRRHGRLRLERRPRNAQGLNHDEKR